MLSKVLTGDKTSRAEVFTFPKAYQSPGSVPIEDEYVQAEPVPIPDRSEEIAGLHRQIDQLRSFTSKTEKDAFAKGRQQGQAEAQADLQPILERLNGSIAEIAGLRPQLRRAAEKDVVSLSLAIAKRILHRELQIDESALVALARFAFERMGRAERYQILVHPRFAASVEGSLPRRQDVSIRVDADPGCAPGTLVIRVENGALDASVDHQLEEITKGLVDRIA